MLKNRFFMFLTIIVATVVIRSLLLHATFLSEKTLRPYVRCINYAIAAKNIHDGNPCVLGRMQKDVAYSEFKESRKHLPAPPELIRPLASGEKQEPFIDEIGILLLFLFTANISGEVSFYHSIYIQIALSALCALAITQGSLKISNSYFVAWMMGLSIALNPLEAMVCICPDLPVWAWYALIATSCAIYIAIDVKKASASSYLSCAGLGLLLGFCVCVRSMNIVYLLVVVGFLVFFWKRGSAHSILIFVFCSCAAVLLVRQIDIGVPTIGRSAFWHTLLAGLSEFGAIEGLEWDDKVINQYLFERNPGIEPLSPEFADTAKEEYFNIISERPLLPLTVFLRRIAEFIIAYRPTKNAWPLITVFAFLKLTSVIGYFWTRSKLRPEYRLFVLFFATIGIANIVSHALIVPLLEIYILPGLLVMCCFATLALIAGTNYLSIRLGISTASENVQPSIQN